MSGTPTVSVVIPTYDRPEMLQRAVESVVAQTYEPIELVVVDDHSPTPAAEALDIVAMDSIESVSSLRHDENRGGSAARSTGIEAANGEWIAFLDDDDKWEPTKIEKQVERAIEADDGSVLVYTGIRQVDSDGSTNAVKTPTTQGTVVTDLLCGNFIGSYSAVMARSSAIEAVGGPDKRFPSWQDWEWYLRLAREGPFLSVTEPLTVRYSEHEQVSSDFESKRDVSYPLLLETGRPIARELGLEREFEARAAFELAWAAIRNERFGDARRYLFQSLRRNPSMGVAWIYLGLSIGGRFTFRPIQRLKRKIVRVRQRV
jgi:glycosyltransferase involved in cell wall biosynthesis